MVVETRCGARRWPTVVAALAAWFVGGCAALALTIAFTVFDDSCPGYEDEGPMAAPDSPYAQVMCDAVVTPALTPMTQIPIPAVLLVPWTLSLAGAAWVIVPQRRSRTRRYVAATLTGVLLLQPLLVLAAQYTLPRDCLSGRTASGDCTRDRELR